ncbi:aminotransferase class V-fold PLP-dependent enzyme [bacterium]|nr:aminotransferase class V-fold PLP-dependent enzyme [bacterium]
MESIFKVGQSLKELLVSINEKPYGTAFVQDQNNKLIGIVTDGDFRRMLLKGKELSDTLKKEDLGEYTYALEGEDFDQLLKKTNNKIHIVPIINSEGELIDYFEFKHQTKFTPVAEPTLENRELEYLLDAFSSTWISSRGKYIDRFEEEFSSYCGVEYGVATSNGTVAIHLALLALGIKEGDEVIVPDLTFAATINAVLYIKATPVIVDIDPDSWTICPKEIQKAITPRTKAIIPVHVYGQPCDMDEIMRIAKDYDLKVIEDCAEAHGAEFNGRKVGSFGDVSTFSFFANKIITTGEGGMCVTNNKELDVQMRKLRDHGMNKEKRYWHDEIGFNYRMTNLQAAIGCAQIEQIDQILLRNEKIEKDYINALSELNLFNWQRNFNNRKKVVWLMCCTTDKRKEVMKALTNNNIDVRPFFYCLSEMPIYSQYTYSNSNALRVSKIGLNLPTVKQVDFMRIKDILSTIS